LKQGSTELGSIVMNIVANLFGMGNAATPLGIKAMGELDNLNRHSSRASNEMCMFVVFNTASIQLVPTTVVSLRQAFGSQNAGAVIVPIWIVSICALTVGIVAAKLMERRVDRL
ncbi:MAG: nucleoside recognition protein, partial [Oscillospiraceae bacterium]